MGRIRFGVSFLAAAAFALVLLSAASAQPNRQARYGGVLTTGIALGEPDVLDPTLARTYGAAQVFRTICEGLYDTDSNLRVVPWLAAALPVISQDKLTYTIPLRKGIVFNDGTPFDAQAVVSSLQRHMTLSGSAQAQLLSPVDSVSASDPSTVVIHLKTRYSPLTVGLTGNAGIAMSPAQLAKLGKSFGTNPVCVGPFMFDGRVAGDSVTVIKSPYYYRKTAVHLDKIVFKIVNDAAAAAAALKAGDLQALDSVSSTQLESVQQTSSLRVLRQNTIGFSSIVFNIGNKNGIGNLPYTNVGTALASSAKLRQAFEEAIDRDTLARVVYAGNVEPGCTLVAPRNTAWYDATNVPCTPYDPADAKRLIAASGVASPTVHLLTPSSSDSQRLAQFIQAQEAAVGITVVIDSVDFVSSLARARAGSFDAFLIGSTGILDPGISFDRWLGTAGSLNFGGYSNPRFDYVMANGFKATTAKARQTLYRVAQQILVADRPIIFLNHLINFGATSTSVTGVQLVSTSFRVAFAQLD